MLGISSNIRAYDFTIDDKWIPIMISDQGVWAQNGLTAMKICIEGFKVYVICEHYLMLTNE